MTVNELTIGSYPTEIQEHDPLHIAFECYFVPDSILFLHFLIVIVTKIYKLLPKFVVLTSSFKYFVMIKVKIAL